MENTCKKCTKCKEVKNTTDFKKFKGILKKDKTRSLLIRSSCKLCDSIMTTEWVKNNPNRKKEWRNENPEKEKEYKIKRKPKDKKWREENKESIFNKKQEYREKNADIILPKKRIQSKKRTELLSDNYIKNSLKSKGIPKDLYNNDNYLEVKRIIIKTQRLCKTSQI